MQMKSIVYQLAVSCSLFCASQAETMAQSGTAPIKQSQSGGINIAISKVSVDRRKITIQFVVTNNVKSRVYILDAWSDQSQRAFLGSGEQLGLPDPSSIIRCNLPLELCMKNTAYRDLSKYSYVEPGEIMAFAFTYNINNPISETDTISFSIALVERIAPVNGNQDDAGPLKALRFNFPYVPLRGR